MKTYGLMFTNDNPASAPSASLSPTLLTFMTLGGTTLAAPGITNPISGLGFYTFEWSPTLPIYFLADGGTLVTDTTQRYLSGILDPVDAVNEQGASTFQMTSIGNSLTVLNINQGSSISAQGLTTLGYAVSIYAGLGGLGSTLTQAIYDSIGTTMSPIGDNVTDPGTVFGLLKRLQEFNEGNQTFNKNTGAWTITARNGVTTLATKTLSNNNTQVTKS